MGDWKSSAIGGSDAKVMKSGVSKCTCLRSYRGGQKNRSYQSDIYMVCFMWSYVEYGNKTVLHTAFLFEW